MVFFAIHMFVQNPIGLMLAALLTRRLFGAGDLPHADLYAAVLSVVLIGFIWSMILSPLWGFREMR